MSRILSIAVLKKDYGEKSGPRTIYAACPMTETAVIKGTSVAGQSLTEELPLECMLHAAAIAQRNVNITTIVLSDKQWYDMFQDIVETSNLVNTRLFAQRVLDAYNAKCDEINGKKFPFTVDTVPTDRLITLRLVHPTHPLAVAAATFATEYSDFQVKHHGSSSMAWGARLLEPPVKKRCFYCFFKKKIKNPHFFTMDPSGKCESVNIHVAAVLRGQKPPNPRREFAYQTTFSFVVFEAAGDFTAIEHGQGGIFEPSINSAIAAAIFYAMELIRKYNSAFSSLYPIGRSRYNLPKRISTICISDRGFVTRLRDAISRTYPHISPFATEYSLPAISLFKGMCELLKITPNLNPPTIHDSGIVTIKHISELENATAIVHAHNHLTCTRPPILYTPN